MTTLFDRDPLEVQWSEVEAFLQSKFPESERLDYKAAIGDEIVDTIVAMANGDGGLILAGVTEANQTPVAWPGVGGKDWLDTLGNHNATESVPPVRFVANAIENPATNKPILLVRVPSSLRKPHTTRKKGPLVRVGSQNRPPDLDLLRRWFLDAHAVALEHRTRQPRLIAEGSSPAEWTLFVSLVAAPAVPLVPLQLTELLDQRIRALLITRARGNWEQSRRGLDHVEFVKERNSGMAHVTAQGESEITLNWPGTNGRVPISIDDLIIALARALCYELRLYREIFEYPDDIYIHASVVRLDLLELSFAVGVVSKLAGSPPTNFDEEVSLTDPSQIDDLAIRLAMHIARQAQTTNYEVGIASAVGDLRSLGVLPVCT